MINSAHHLYSYHPHFLIPFINPPYTCQLAIIRMKKKEKRTKQNTNYVSVFLPPSSKVNLPVVSIDQANQTTSTFNVSCLPLPSPLFSHCRDKEISILSLLVNARDQFH